MIKSDGFSHQSLSSKVTEYLKEQIFLKRYQGGERILESRVARKLDISRAPVREAIKELQNQGLINIVPRKGSFVVDFDDDDIKEIYEIRVLLENRILKNLIEEDKLNESDYEYLSDIIDDMIKIADSDQEFNHKIMNMNKQDITFHSYLWNKSGKRWTVKILTTLHHQLKFVMMIDLNQEENLIESAKKHYDIIQALKQGNLERAKKSLVAHIVNYNEKLMDKIR